MTANLVDQDARARALRDDTSNLVIEAGAGTGKTALMAGRIVRLLADGHPPASLAAITFTELAAGELQQRVARFVGDVLADDLPEALVAAFDDGPTATQCDALAAAQEALDQLTCTTIHGFCKQLIRPYPVEAQTDPGARMVEPAAAALVHGELRDEWLRERLSGEAERDDVLAQMLLRDTDAAIKNIHAMADFLQKNRGADAEPVDLTRADLRDFEKAVEAFRTTVQDYGEPGCDEWAQQLADLRNDLAARLDTGPDAAALLAVANPRPIGPMKSGSYAFRQWNKKTKLIKAAQGMGLSKAEAEEVNANAHDQYEAADVALHAFLQRAAAALTYRIVRAFDGLSNRYQQYKRETALLDFDDLLFYARDLLREHPDVRDALARRYRKILVDEFQDTDPLQAEILWRLTEATPCKPPEAHWSERRPEAGRLFLVGDPKQSVYRFRGADVDTYLAARDALVADTGDLLAIRTNFRSKGGLLDWVNTIFEEPLSAPSQPGFEALAPEHEDPADAPRVVALDHAVEPSEAEKDPTVDDMRRAEARVTAELCRRLIGSARITDPDDGERACRAGDIALIAPAGTALWIYESALEAVGLPIATQAGKGAFRRQEILDLIALARVLADGRDTLALGAFLRGPLIGLTEEQLLDCADAIPRDPARSDRIRTLDLNVEPDNLPHAVAAHALKILQRLRRRARRTTPFELLAEAVEQLRVRPILRQRYAKGAERALANVDLFLDLARPYSVRGLKAFARDMRTRWDESADQAEGRPDAREQAVQVITMHSAKGLEWPVVIPINAMGAPRTESGIQLRRRDQTLHAPLTQIGPPSAAYEEAKQANTEAQNAERVRLWYVTCTRAKQLVVLPRPDVPPKSEAWVSMVGLGIGEFPAIDLDAYYWDVPEGPQDTGNPQDAEKFSAEAERVAGAHPRIQRRNPSGRQAVDDTEALSESAVTVFSEEDLPPIAQTGIQGSTARGNVMHKLLEELLTGETGETELAGRAGQLLNQLGEVSSENPAQGPCPGEIAKLVRTAVSCPEVAELRGRLVPEYPVAASTVIGDAEKIVTGIADAVICDAQGHPDVIIDWKSDVSPTSGMRKSYRRQMQDYLAATDARLGLVVYASNAEIEHVEPS